MGDEGVEVPQYYSDQFTLGVGPFGCAMTFGLTHPAPMEGGPGATPVATMRMSLEHLKAVAFIMHRQIVSYQRDFQVQVEVPDKMLAALSITREQWRSFWGEK